MINWWVWVPQNKIMKERSCSLFCEHVSFRCWFVDEEVTHSIWFTMWRRELLTFHSTRSFERSKKSFFTEKFFDLMKILGIFLMFSCVELLIFTILWQWKWIFSFVSANFRRLFPSKLFSETFLQCQVTRDMLNGTNLEFGKLP